MKSRLIYILLMSGMVFIACKKDNNSGPPIITKVRSLDTTKRDSTFTRATPGTMIVIQGSNMGGLQAVFFNDTLAYFNPVYATSTDIIVTIPSTAQTKATNSTVPDIIKIVTDHGTTTYAFQLYLPPPYISSIALDNSGTIVTINGGNFQGIKKITFPVTGGTSGDTAKSYTINKAFNQITAVIPSGTPFVDSLRVYCTFGTAAVSYPPPMTISSVSNENGVAGTTIHIMGTNFIGVNKVTFPGNISGTNLQTISVNELTVTVPSGITTSDSLRVSGALGKVSSPQLFDSYIVYPSPGYLSTFEQQWASDNTSFVGWTGGYGDGPTVAASYPGGTGAAGLLLQGSPMAANSSAGSQGNAGLLQLNETPWIGSTGTAVANYSLKFEISVGKPWSAGEIWIAVGGWYGWTSYTARYAPWETAAGGKFQPNGWVTATIPLSQFIKGNDFSKTSWSTAGAPASVFSDYPSTAVGFLIMNDQGTAVPANSMNIAIDNVRIVKGR